MEYDDLAFILNNRSKLRKSETKVAAYVLEHREECIQASVSELAELTGVSDPTVIRFCRALGFRGFQDFKIRLAQSVVPRERQIHETARSDEPIPELVRKIFDSNTAALRDTLATLDYAQVEASVRDLAEAGKIIFFGLGGSAVVAMDAYHKFFRLGVPCEWFNDGHLAVMAASMMRPRHVLVAISHSGSSRDVVDTLEVAKDAGARTIAIVSHHISPVSRTADRTLCVAAIETGYKLEPMASRIAQLTVIDVLSVGVALARSDEVLENLGKSRRALVRKRY
ncbi:MAG TPA: MurR/RpiR family transcriptional regulator [Magnetospirillaceae bacterium]|nr:MurR/RpiR family transcriptional regulator [Magnetospirillaceae bacterium]